MQNSVLIVEDEKDIREAITVALRRQNYQVFNAENGETGLQLALANEPSLILLDLIMPVMNGHMMLDKLRADSWGQTAKVIVLTSMDDTADVEATKERDISDYIVKSNTSLQEIVKKVDEVLASDKQ